MFDEASSHPEIPMEWQTVLLDEIRGLRSELKSEVRDLRRAIDGEIDRRHIIDKKIERVSLKSGFWGTVGGILSIISMKIIGH